MDIGRLNKRITFYKLTDQGKDEYNRTIQKAIPYKTIWASVEPLTGKEYLEADKNSNEQNHRIYTRYFSDLDVNMLIGYKSRKFEIKAIINYREKNEMLQFACVEKVGETIE